MAFESFKVDNITIFDKNKIKPVFFEEISYLAQTQPGNVFLDVSDEKEKKMIESIMNSKNSFLKNDKSICRSQLFIKMHQKAKNIKSKPITVDNKSFLNIKVDDDNSSR